VWLKDYLSGELISSIIDYDCEIDYKDGNKNLCYQLSDGFDKKLLFLR
jgi:hypothetical protein